MTSDMLGNTRPITFTIERGDPFPTSGLKTGYIVIEIWPDDESNPLHIYVYAKKAQKWVEI